MSAVCHNHQHELGSSGLLRSKMRTNTSLLSHVRSDRSTRTTWSSLRIPVENGPKPCMTGFSCQGLIYLPTSCKRARRVSQRLQRPLDSPRGSLTNYLVAHSSSYGPLKSRTRFKAFYSTTINYPLSSSACFTVLYHSAS